MQCSVEQYSVVQCREGQSKRCSGLRVTLNLCNWTAPSCSALQLGAPHCPLMPCSYWCFIVQCNAVQYTAMHGSTLRWSAVQYSVVQCSWVYCSEVQYKRAPAEKPDLVSKTIFPRAQYKSNRYSYLLCTVAYNTALHCTALHCTLQWGSAVQCRAALLSSLLWAVIAIIMRNHLLNSLLLTAAQKTGPFYIVQWYIQWSLQCCVQCSVQCFVQCSVQCRM